jgi:hypothetical protein
MIAREIARDLTLAQAQITPRHLKGKFNDVSDLLSFAGLTRGKENTLTADNPTNALLTHRLHNSPYQQLIPKNFRICPLPDKVSGGPLRVNIRDLLKAFGTKDPPPTDQAPTRPHPRDASRPQTNHQGLGRGVGAHHQ